MAPLEIRFGVPCSLFLVPCSFVLVRWLVAGSAVGSFCFYFVLHAGFPKVRSNAISAASRINFMLFGML